MDLQAVLHFLEVTLYAFLALTAVLNPVGNIPVFIEITQGLDAKIKQKLFRITVITGFSTLLAMTFTGRWIMEFVFQIKLEEFRIAGGILLIIIAINQIVFHHPAKKEVENPDNVLEMAAVPLAIPLLVGPGSIVTGILILDREGWIVAIVSIVLVFILTWFILRFSGTLYKFLGKFGALVLGRVLYIFIAAIGVHFLLTGVSRYFKLG